MGYRNRNRYASRDPYWLDARFASVCSCGQKIRKGDQIYYYPNGRTAVCEKCGEQGERDMNAERSMELSGGRSDCMFDW